MGFRNIRDFNLALLGEQAWRLMMEPQSFISRLLEARYFSSGSFEEAGIMSNPSFVWHSIIEAKELNVQEVYGKWEMASLLVNGRILGLLGPLSRSWREQV